MDVQLFSIGEVSKILGVSDDTLRLWDKKEILKSFRPFPTSKRYYRKSDINNFLGKKDQENDKDIFDYAKKWTTSKIPNQLSDNKYCETSDVFAARLQKFNTELSKISEMKNIFPLITAIIGEIGNNSYNHNIGNWPDMIGILFEHNPSKKQIILADRGRGILATLKRVVPKLKNDKEALKTAFTKYISGRAPENRGNGLKFVKDVVSANPFELIFYSGKAVLSIKKNSTKFTIKKIDTPLNGCLAVINY